MKDRYDDLQALGKLAKKAPLWYDENGAPRFCQFKPDATPNIYDDEVVLLKIRCQDSRCQRTFHVQMGRGMFETPISDRIRQFKRGKTRWVPLHYGDPPNHGCVGDTMNCEDIGVLEYYRKIDHTWKRLRRYEISFEGDWRKK